MMPTMAQLSDLPRYKLEEAYQLLCKQPENLREVLDCVERGAYIRAIGLLEGMAAGLEAQGFKR